MKKILMVLGVLLLITIVIIVYMITKPNLSRTCKLADFGISFKIPYTYSEVNELADNRLLNLYHSKNEITIKAADLGRNFWSSEKIEERMDEYIKVITAANYDSNVKGIKQEVIEVSGGRFGRVEIEVERPNQTLKTISLITESNNGNVVIEIYGEKADLEEKNEEIEAIIASAKIGKNKHVYIEDLLDNEQSGDIAKSGEEKKS